MPSASPNSLFYNTFIGEYIQLVGKFNLSNEAFTATIEGYLLDVDDSYYYMGHNADAIECAIKKDLVNTIEIIQPQDKYTKLLDNYVTDDKQVN